MKKATALIFTFVLLICLIANIGMLCTPVFGSYTRTTESGTTTYTFYANTYTCISENEEKHYSSYTTGFYKYIPKDKYSKADYDTITLDNLKLKRDSVFSISRTINNSFQDTHEEYVYVNYLAIILQVIFAVLIIVSLIYLIRFIMKTPLP